MKDVLVERDGERITAVGGILPKEKDAATQAFEAALIQKLKAILERPLSSQVLLELEMSARLGRQFLMLSEGPAAMPRQGFGMGGLGGGFIDDLGYGGGAGALIGPPQQAETWGAGVLRELVAKVGDINKRPPALDDLMAALRMAEKDGRTELVEKIKAQIDSQLATSELGVTTEELDFKSPGDGSESKRPEDTLMKLTFIVSGQEVVQEMCPHETLRAWRNNALTRSGNLGRPVDDWEVRDSKGNRIMGLDTSVEEHGFVAGEKFFLTLPVGAGGSA